MTPPCTAAWTGIWPRLVGLMVWVALAVNPAQSAEPAGKRQFNIPAGVAERSLRQLSEQSGVEVLYPSEAVTGVRTRAVQGEMTPREAIDALLAGTALVAIEGRNSNSLTVRRETRNGEAEKNDPRVVTAPNGPGDRPKTPELQGTGTLQGRVVNAAGKTPLESVRIVLEGRSMETLTNAAGVFRLSHVPAGPLRMSVVYAGFESIQRVLTLAQGEVARTDFELHLDGLAKTSDEPAITLEQVTVAEEHLSAQAAALNDQKVAANLKNVVSFEEFGDMGEGNPGEFLKYVPGVSMLYVYGTPQFASIRGMPANGTLVLIDGSPIASSAGDRQFEFTGAATGSIDRIEVTKSPTPDLPANSIGGAINIVGRSGFGRKAAAFKYSAFSTFSVLSDYPGINLQLGKAAGPEPRMSARPVQPAADLSYVLPVSEDLVFTLAGSASRRYNNNDLAQSIWNLSSVVNERYLKSNFLQIADKQLASVAMDWRMSNLDVLRATFQYTTEDTRTANNSVDMRFGTGATGGETFTQSRANVGVVTEGFNGSNVYRGTLHTTLRYAHEGDVWNFDADVAYSRSRRRARTAEDGFFSNITASYTTLTLRADGMNRVYDGTLPLVSATRQGAAVDVFDGNRAPITAAFTAMNRYENEVRGMRANLAREFDGIFPVRFKVGLAVNRENLDLRTGAETYAVAVPAAAGGNTAGNLGVIDADFSLESEWFDFQGRRVPVSWISPTKLFEVSRQHPEYFTLNQAAAYTSRVNGSRQITETISAAYVRFDTRHLQNKLRLTYGARFERTEDRGLGALNDVLATYARDATGNIVRNAAGVPVKVPGDALALARLQYKERAATNTRDYDGLYPSVNAAYSFTDKLIARAAYARTTGRPAMSLIIPGVVVSDQTTANAEKTVTVSNTGLRPWNSNSYDLSLEAYHLRGAVFSVGVFRKDIDDFFSRVELPATPELLASFGLPDEYLDYEISTRRNFGSATVNGCEWSYRQSLDTFARWAKGFQIFANGTHLSLSGPNAEDFTNFSPRNFNWGASYARKRLLLKVNVAESGRVKVSSVEPSATIPEGTYQYLAPQTIVDVSIEYRFFKYLSLFGNARNANQSTKYTQIYNAATPEFARIRIAQRTGALISLGVKGTF
ncbi:MAG: TonB-dependent receptor [Opitutaceae bacterium]|nr:TonB-dependent receptor [Opitutaceae bacterium]